MRSFEPNIQHPASQSYEADFNAMLLRNKALIWHVCSDYNLERIWNTEDCMQEVFINLWRDYGKFEGRSSEKTWVWRVATNTMLKLRQKSERIPAADTLERDSAAENVADASDSGDYQLIRLIDELPEKDGIVIRAFLDGFSYKEIADMTGNTVGAVAMRIARIKRRLKRMFEKENT